MDQTAEIEELRARVSALEDLLVTALCLALKSTEPKYQEMMWFWLQSMSRVDLATHNMVAGWDLGLDDDEDTDSNRPLEGAEAARFTERQRIAIRVSEAMNTMFEEPLERPPSG